MKGERMKVGVWVFCSFFKWKDIPETDFKSSWLEGQETAWESGIDARCLHTYLFYIFDFGTM